MTYPLIELEVDLSIDQRYIFSQCRFFFETVVVGDYEQVVLAKILLSAFEDLVFRLDRLELVACSQDDMEDAICSTLQRDMKNSCLPLGVESFDGDQAIFVNVSGQSFILIKPWGACKVFSERLSVSQYRSSIVSAINILKRRMETLNK